MTKTEKDAPGKEYASFIRDLELESLYAERCLFEVKGRMPANPMSIHLRETPQVRDITEDRVVIEHTYRLEIKEKGQKKLFVLITATFVAAYLTHRQPSDEVLKRFLDRNVRLNTWPFFRELAYSSLTRMNLPPLVLPVLKR